MRVPSGFSLREGERPIWYGRRSFKSVIGYIIVGLVLLLFGGGLAAVGGVAAGFGVLLILVAIILFIHTLHNSSPTSGGHRVLHN